MANFDEAKADVFRKNDCTVEQLNFFSYSNYDKIMNASACPLIDSSSTYKGYWLLAALIATLSLSNLILYEEYASR